MAKFKVGDKVELLANPYAGIGNVVEVTPVGTIKAVFPERSGDTVNVFLERDLRLANSCRSRNAVVANALNACGTARNACARNGGIDDFNVGDRVLVRSIVGFTPTAPKPGTITAIYKSDNRIAVKKDDGGRGLFDASLVTKNACGTARNADGASFGSQRTQVVVDVKDNGMASISLFPDKTFYGIDSARSFIELWKGKLANLEKAIAWCKSNGVK